MATCSAISEQHHMQGLGDRIRARARALGFSDSEVARRLGQTPQRFGKYVRDLREPDYATLLRLCGVLACTPTDLLVAAPSEDTDVHLSRIRSALSLLSGDDIELVAAVAEAAAAVRLSKKSTDAKTK